MPVFEIKIIAQFSMDHLISTVTFSMTIKYKFYNKVFHGHEWVTFCLKKETCSFANTVSSIVFFTLYNNSLYKNSHQWGPYKLHRKYIEPISNKSWFGISDEF